MAKNQKDDDLLYTTFTLYGGIIIIFSIYSFTKGWWLVRNNMRWQRIIKNQKHATN
jgi:hypothetical protein